MSEPPLEVRQAQLQEIQDRLDRGEITSDDALFQQVRLASHWYRLRTGREWPS